MLAAKFTPSPSVCLRVEMATFSGDKSMRVNYNTNGVAGYYSEQGGCYRNPHFAAIVHATASIMEAWWPLLLQQSHASAAGGEVKCLDLACGAGEATQAVQGWWSRGPEVSRRPPPIRTPVTVHADTHVETATASAAQTTATASLASASAASTSEAALRPFSSRLRLQIDACDPYTHQVRASLAMP